MKTIKANGKSKSGKTFYFDFKVPAGVLEPSEGMFSGSCDKEIARIDEISWVYCFGRNLRRYRNITKNGRYQLKDYIEVIEKHCTCLEMEAVEFWGDVLKVEKKTVSETVMNIEWEDYVTDEDFEILDKVTLEDIGEFNREHEDYFVNEEKVAELVAKLSETARPVVDWAIRNARFVALEFPEYEREFEYDEYYESKGMF